MYHPEYLPLAKMSSLSILCYVYDCKFPVCTVAPRTSTTNDKIALNKQYTLKLLPYKKKWTNNLKCVAYGWMDGSNSSAHKHTLHYQSDMGKPLLIWGLAQVRNYSFMFAVTINIK